MKLSFWTKFLIDTAMNTGIAALTALVQQHANDLSPAQLQAVETALQANQAVITAFTGI